MEDAMRTLSKLGLAAVCAAGLAGTAAAAPRNTHVVNVALPDGSVAHVEYVGDVAPSVIVVPASPVAWSGFAVPTDLPMAGFDDMFARMDREMAATMREIDQLARQPLAVGGQGVNLAAYGSVPAGTSSYSVVTVSENGRQCSRSTQVIGQGAGKAPKVVSKLSGDCGPASSAAPTVPIPDGPIHQS
jgi:hypothetical protein